MPIAYETHNYVKKMVQMQQAGELPRNVGQATVYHDEWCGIYTQQRCNCDPEIEVIWAPCPLCNLEEPV